MRQVRAYIDKMDLGYHIQKAASERLSDVVNNAVTIALRERVKQRAKEMARDGTLFQGGDEA
jgi:hypothetical protein